MLITEGNRNS